MANRHVFVSYCHDNQTVVARLRLDLVRAGIPVWWDQEILPGADWKLEIRKAMRAAFAVVACLSKETSERATTGVYPELLDAIAAYRQHQPGSTFLIPVRLSPCDIPLIEIDDTRTLDRIQAIDLFPEGDYEQALGRLVRALHAARPKQADKKPDSAALRSMAPAPPPATTASERSPLGTWKEKLDFLRIEEAKTSNAAQKFELQQQIDEAKAKIKELEGG